MRFAGQHIKHYRILEKVNEGGMGIVCKVLDTQLDVVRAIKILRPALVRDEKFMERFGREARSLARLNHPHILTVHAYYDEPPNPFIVMEYVGGPSLGALIRRKGPLDDKQALPLFKQILQGLSYAHRKGILHRDIKPSNILLSDEGQVKIADFGLAKKQDSADLTLSAMPIGTLHYMSPEHVRSMAEVDHRSDLYAVGMALYEALTGRTPFQEEDTAYIIMRTIVEEDFAPPTQFAPSLPEELAQIVLKALARDPDDRYQSADEMLAALETFEAKTLSSPPPETPAPETPARPTVRPVSTGSLKTWMAYAAVLLALVVTVALAWWALRDILATSTPTLVVPAEAVDSVTIRPGIYERILSSVGPATSRQGVLLLKAVPYGSISVGGRQRGEDSLEVTVAPGRRRVFFTHPDYGMKQRVVEIGAGQRKEVICYFEGLLRVQASDKDGLPLQAELFVDDQGTGRRTPVEDPYTLPPGAYTVEVFLEGYLGGATSVVVLPVLDDSLLKTPPIEPLEFVLQKVEE